MIDVFLSRPTRISEEFRSGLDNFLRLLRGQGLAPHTLGTTDYPTKGPLDEVIGLLDRCRGAIILGYPQIEVTTGTIRGELLTQPLVLPTEWNHIEAGLAYARGLPLLLIHHASVSRGVFDRGAINTFVYARDLSRADWSLAEDVSGAIVNWKTAVVGFVTAAQGGEVTPQLEGSGVAKALANLKSRQLNIGGEDVSLAEILTRLRGRLSITANHVQLAVEASRRFPSDRDASWIPDFVGQLERFGLAAVQPPKDGYDEIVFLTAFGKRVANSLADEADA